MRYDEGAAGGMSRPQQRSGRGKHRRRPAGHADSDDVRLPRQLGQRLLGPSYAGHTGGTDKDYGTGVDQVMQPTAARAELFDVHARVDDRSAPRRAPEHGRELESGVFRQTLDGDPVPAGKPPPALHFAQLRTGCAQQPGVPAVREVDKSNLRCGALLREDVDERSGDNAGPHIGLCPDDYDGEIEAAGRGSPVADEVCL